MLASSALRAAVLPSDDAAFAQDLSRLQVQPIQQTVQQIADHQTADRYSRLIAAQFSWYGEAEQKPGLDASQVAQAVLAGLKQGAYDAVEFGESHSNPLEQDAAQLIIKDILGGGVPVGAFLQEATQVQNSDGTQGQPVGIFAATEALSQAQVSLLLMKNQFDPGDDVDAGLKAAGAKMLITYSGSAHTSARMRDYIIDTLKDSDLGWGNIYPGRPVIEQTLRKRRKNPVIIAMQEESFVFGLILEANIKDASHNVTLDQWQANLAALQAAWDRTTATFQPATGIRFVQSGEQPNFYVGMAAGERRPLQLEAIEKVAQMPELKAWLGDKKVKGVSAG
jgi:hypothetical protein